MDSYGGIPDPRSHDPVPLATTPVSIQPVMTDSLSEVTFERVTDLQVANPTLIEGLPGHGLVAAIAVEQVREQFDLHHYGNVHADVLPPVASFDDGRIQDTFRVYAGREPPVLTLQSEMPVSKDAFRPLARGVLATVAPEVDRAIFLGGMPAQSQTQIGRVVGVATDAAMERQVTDAGVDLVEGQGTIGGITGALIRACYRRSIPAIGLFVRTNPFIPDPTAAKAVIEDGLEPLVPFEIETAPLDEQAEAVRSRLEQVARQYREAQEDQTADRDETWPGMFQ